MVVIKYLGAKGAAGMAYVCSFLGLFSGFGLDKFVSLITGGKISDSHRGCVIAHTPPETGQGGPVAVVESGNIIAIDIPNRELNSRFFRSVEPALMNRSKWQISQRPKPQLIWMPL